MKRLLLFFSLFFFLSVSVFSQNPDNEKKYGARLSGFVWYEAFYDTYKSVDTRDGNLILYPERPNFDSEGSDINETGQFEMLSVQTRLTLNITGPDAFGAETSGIIETDFEGTSQALVRTVRMRHAFLNLKWEKADLMLGQFWHPLFLTENFPKVLAFGAALPTEPFSRAPQARYTYHAGSWDIIGASIVHGYNRSPGEYQAQRNAGLPEMLFQLRYKGQSVFAGATASYKVLKPRLQTDLGYKTDETVGSYTTQAFLKISVSPVIVKMQTVYGENLAAYTMIGGYAAQDGTIDSHGNFEYTNMQTLAAWAEIMSDYPSFNYGLFVGYTENLGFANPVEMLDGDFLYDAGRALDMASLWRISPRVSYTSGPIMLGLEYMYNLADYGTDFNENYKALTTETSENHRFLLAVKYNF